MFAIKGGKILTITDGVIEGGTILVDSGKIVKVGKRNKVPEDAEVIDVTGRVVMPGLIDAHCHIGIIEEKIGWAGGDGNEMTDPATPHMRALDAIKAITIIPAEILGVADRVGSIEKGKDADLRILDGDPLELRTRVEMVLIDGEIAYKA